MRKEPWAALAVLLAMSGCGGSNEKASEAGKESGTGAAPSAPAAGAGARLNPGQWEIVTESGGMSGVQLPPQAAQMMKGLKVSTQTCITPEEAERPNSGMFAGKQDKNCTYRQFDRSGGTLKAAIVCGGKGGEGTTTVTSEGRYGGDAFDIRSRIKIAGPGAGMTMESHVTGRRIGECKA